MKEFEATQIGCMKKRGIIAVAWKLYRRSHWPLLGYIIIGTLITMLPQFVLSLANISRLDALTSLSADELSRYVMAYSYLFPITMLLLLGGGLVILPIINGACATQTTLMMNGRAQTFGELFKNTGKTLKRYFTTNLAIIAYGLLIAIAFIFLFFIFMIPFAFSQLNNITAGIYTPNSTSALVGPIIMLIVMYIAIYFVSMLPQFAFMVNAHEGITGFGAIRRSIKLVFCRFWRAMLIPLGILLVICLPYIIILLLGAQYPIVRVILLLVYLIPLMLVLPVFMRTLTAAQYFDAYSKYLQKHPPAAEAQPEEVLEPEPKLEEQAQPLMEEPENKDAE